MKRTFLGLFVILFTATTVFTSCKKDDGPKTGDPNTYTYGGVTFGIQYAGYAEYDGMLFFGLCPTEPGRRGMLEESEFISFYLDEDFLDEDIDLYYSGASSFSSKVKMMKAPASSEQYIAGPPFGFTFKTGQRLHQFYPDGRSRASGTLLVTEGRKAGEYTIEFDIELERGRVLEGKYTGIFKEADPDDLALPMSLLIK